VIHFQSLLFVVEGMMIAIFIYSNDKYFNP
jgi:hypothetical protein